jgi:transposase
MARPRMGMRKTREILRQKWSLRRSHREVSASLRVSLGTITETLQRAQVAGLNRAKLTELDDAELEKRLYGERTRRPGSRPKPNCPWIHTELRKKGVTLQLLHLEYLEVHPDGYQYTQFCEIYRRWAKKRRLSMRQVHRAGEKMFVDYAGQKPHYVDASTGEIIEVELFVAVLGASSYTFAEATRTQKGPEWIGSHQRAFRFFGGVANATVCDQLKSGVVVPCRYEPGVQRTYEELAEHYGTVIVPARPRSPKGRVDDWRGGGRTMGVAVSGCFRCAGASLHAMAPFPVAARRTGRADFPHPALIPAFMPSRSAGREEAPLVDTGRASRRDTRAGTGGTRCLAFCASSRAISGAAVGCTKQVARRPYARVPD